MEPTTEETLDDIFDAPTETAEAPQEAPQVETAQTGEEPKHDTMSDASETVPPTETVTEEPSVDESPTVPVAALKDERNKRQELERQLEELKARSSVPQPTQPPVESQPQPTQPAVMPDPLEDPEAFNKWYTETQEQAQLAQEQAMYNNRVATSKMIVSQQYEDYGEAEKVFAEALAMSPDLQRQVVASDNPALFAYQVGKKLMTFNAMGDDPEAYINQQVEARLAQQGQQVPQQSPVSDAPVPQSLASTASAQPRNSKGQFEDASIHELLPD